MGKAFLIGIPLAVFIAIGAVFLSGLGLIPAPVYSFLYVAELHIPFFQPNIIPYLEKFEGNWNVSLTPSPGVSSTITNCTTTGGLVHVHNGVFSGTIGHTGSALPFTATTTEEGSLVAAFGGVTLYVGQVQATLQGAAGQGEWSDNYGCSGTAQFQKIDPVVDPVLEQVVSAKGDTELVRDGIQEPLMPGLALYAGDEIHTGDGQVLLSTGPYANPITVGADTTYKVRQ